MPVPPCRHCRAARDGRRKYGLSCDNLIGAEIVTAAGEVLRADAGEKADLFWAIRGGGNFG